MANVLKKKVVFAGIRKHVIPAEGGMVAWDLCFLKPSIRLLNRPL